MSHLIIIVLAIPTSLLIEPSQMINFRRSRPLILISIEQLVEAFQMINLPCMSHLIIILLVIPTSLLIEPIQMIDSYE